MFVGQDAQAASERERLRATFETAADLYQRARPAYPPALFDDLVDIAQLLPGDHLFEVGCATGTATVPLAERGFRITAIELGAELAAAARANLADYSNVTIIDGDFETWTPPVGLRYDMMFAATAWHWIDPAVRYVKAFDMVRPGGHLAVWTATHVVPAGGDALFHEIQDVYDEIGEGLPPPVGFPRPGELDERTSSETAMVCSRQSQFATSTGRRSTTLRAISTFSTLSPVISRCSRGNEIGSTARFDGVSTPAPTVVSVDTGAPSSRSRVVLERLVRRAQS